MYKYSSDTGEQLFTEAEQSAIDQAQVQLDVLDSVPRRIQLMMIALTYQYGLNITKTQCQNFMNAFEESYFDEIYKERCRLIDITGHKSHPITQSNVCRVSTNPQTYADKKEAL